METQFSPRRAISGVIKIRSKTILSKLIPDSLRAQYLCYLPKLETWRRKHNERYPFFHSRYHLYDYLNNEVLRNGQIEYLEFGVYRGASINYWSTINSCTESRFVGFDTFDGLPERWDYFSSALAQKHFDVRGQIPNVSDTRVSFVKGLFQDTLPVFLTQRRPIGQQLVIHNDADLYSSTLYVLTQLNSVIIPGTIVVFDEFSSVLHEFRALEDYCVAYRRFYDILAATKSGTDYYTNVAVRFR